MMQAEKEACEVFMNLTFTELIKKILENQYFPLISSIVD
jgi:hypothetical protein